MCGTLCYDVSLHVTVCYCVSLYSGVREGGTEGHSPWMGSPFVLTQLVIELHGTAGRRGRGEEEGRGGKRRGRRGGRGGRRRGREHLEQGRDHDEDVECS